MVTCEGMDHNKGQLAHAESVSLQPRLLLFLPILNGLYSTKIMHMGIGVKLRFAQYWASADPDSSFQGNTQSTVLVKRSNMKTFMPPFDFLNSSICMRTR